MQKEIVMFFGFTFLLIQRTIFAQDNYKELEERVVKLEEKVEKIESCNCQTIMKNMMHKEKMSINNDAHKKKMMEKMETKNHEKAKKEVIENDKYQSK